MSHPTIERLHELLVVNTTHGMIRWRKTQGRAAAGSVAGRIDTRGYREVCIDRLYFKAHHIVWFIETGDWPERIDHINGVRDDNRFTNLREATAADNARNRTNWRHTKLLGAHRYGDRWNAVISADGAQYVVGTFDTEEEAHQRYVEARRACELAERSARTAVLEGMAWATYRRDPERKAT